MTVTAELAPGDYARLAAEQLEEVRQLLADRSQFEPTRQSQWRVVRSGLLVEAGYVYGEPWAKVLSTDGRRELIHFKFSGRNRDELSRFLAAVTS